MQIARKETNFKHKKNYRMSGINYSSTKIQPNLAPCIYVSMCLIGLRVQSGLGWAGPFSWDVYFLRLKIETYRIQIDPIQRRRAELPEQTNAGVRERRRVRGWPPGQVRADRPRQRARAAGAAAVARRPGQAEAARVIGDGWSERNGGELGFSEILIHGIYIYFPSLWAAAACWEWDHWFDLIWFGSLLP